MNPGKIVSMHDCSSTCLIRFLFLPAAIPDSQGGPRILGGKQDNEHIKNLIPEEVTTPPPRIHQQPFDYDGEVFIGSQTDERPEDEYPEENEQEEEEEEEDNHLTPRGDVFSKSPFVCLHCNNLRVLGGPQCANPKQIKLSCVCTVSVIE